MEFWKAFVVIMAIVAIVALTLITFGKPIKSVPDSGEQPRKAVSYRTA
jgi:hypothetical protein